MNLNKHSLFSIKEAPSYDRDSLNPSIVHIGLGHFHRSHFLTYLDTLNRNGYAHEGVFETDIMPANPAFIKALRAQDYLYSVLSWSGDGSKQIRINAPVIGYANAVTEPETVLEKYTAPGTKLITLTITEKGYHYLDDRQSLNWDDSDVKNDLLGATKWPKTAVGYLALALKTRAEKNLPLTIMSCDNIPENGHVLKTCILQFCKKKYPEIVSWVEKNTAFPCTMVDRITPGTTEEDTQVIETAYGYCDLCPVHSEDFLQWVIEDTKATDIPDFSKAGAMLVKDVKPYELMKIRLLNGSHSALAYPSYLMGFRFVDQAAKDPLIQNFIRNYYMEEITATLSAVPGIDLNKYKDNLIERFSNSSIRDTILRLASDGSKKIANAIAKPLMETDKNSALILALALWARFCEGRDEQGVDLPIDDPLATELTNTCHDAEAFLANVGLTPVPKAITTCFAAYREEIDKTGVKATITRFIKDYT